MLKRYACTRAELSCIIGNLFVELSPPCEHCGEDTLTITGTTVTGSKATLFVTAVGFDFEGCAEDTVMIDRCVLEANELDLRDAQEYRQRQKLQAKALTYCKELLFFIELSQEMGFISMSSCEYWSKLALEVKYMTTAWKKRDKTRA